MVSSDQRFTSGNPCPVCGGSTDDARGNGTRCYGYLSDDEKWGHCTREEHGGGCPYHEDSQTYAHRLDAPCKCGQNHLELDDGANGQSANGYKADPVVDEVFNYRDERGNLLYQTIRWRPKGFSVRHPCPDNKTGYTYNMGGNPKKCQCSKINPVLLDLPDLSAADRNKPVYITEGEKHSRRLQSLGLVSTTFPFGAGKSKLVQNVSALLGRDIIILIDNEVTAISTVKQGLSSFTVLPPVLK